MSVSAEIKEKSKLTKEEWREYTKTVWHIANTSHPDHPAVFPVEIPSRLIKLFTFYGDRVLDPFAGTGTTAQAALQLGRKAVCVEQNSRYVKIIRDNCNTLFNRPTGDDLQIVDGDSRDLSFLPDDSVDLVVTSPPYWNKAAYGNGSANLGNIGGYKQFFREIRPVFAECLRVLKPGRKFCLVTANVNQHTNHGLLTFPLASDFTFVLRDLGLVMINEIIWSKDGTGGRWGSANSQRPIFGSYPYPPNFLFKNVHEFVLIFAKPPKTAVKGPKVLHYEQLMLDEEAAPALHPSVVMKADPVARDGQNSYHAIGAAPRGKKNGVALHPVGINGSLEGAGNGAVRAANGKAHVSEAQDATIRWKKSTKANARRPG